MDGVVQVLVLGRGYGLHFIVPQKAFVVRDYGCNCCVHGSIVGRWLGVEEGRLRGVLLAGFKLILGLEML